MPSPEKLLANAPQGLVCLLGKHDRNGSSPFVCTIKDGPPMQGGPS